MKVNLGCGHSYIEGWVNVDANPDVRADIYLDAFEFVRRHGPEVSELYMGHFLEHLMPASAVALLALIRDRLPEGAQVSAVVPDMPAVFAAYEAGVVSNDFLNERFVYSYEQPSHHVWCYDIATLIRVFEESGLVGVAPIDPLTWEPVYWKEGPESRWQCGARATVPTPSTESTVVIPPWPEPAHEARELPPTRVEALMHRIEQLRAELEAAHAAHTELVAGDAPLAAPEAAPAGPAPAGAPHGPSYFDRLPGPLGGLARRGLPEGSAQRKLARFSIDAASQGRHFARAVRASWGQTGFTEPAKPTYALWRRQHHAPRAELAAQRRIAERSVEPVGIHCVVWASGSASVRRTIASLTGQTWRHWTATVIGGRDAQRAVDAAHDPRIEFMGSAPGLVEATNHALAHQPIRDLAVFLGDGDTLAPEAFFEIATRAWRDPLLDLVYWDDDLVDKTGRRSSPRFRPSWSPDTLLGANYLDRAFAMRIRRVLFVDGLRTGLEQAVWWDLVLRAGLTPERVGRVPRVLADVVARPTVSPEVATTVVRDHVERRGLPATVEHRAGMVRVTWVPATLPHVSIVIPTRHNRLLLARCLESIRHTDYPSLDVVVVDNGERTPANEAWYASAADGLDLHVEWWTAPFNYSAVNNAAARRARGDVLVFLNDDTEAADPGWLREMVGWAVQPEIGLVGAQLLDGDGLIQHGGVVLGLNGFADHLFQGMRPNSESLLGPTNWYRNVLSVTAACVAVRRALFEEIGGFDERFELCGSDVALGLDAVMAGKRNVCTAFAGVRHLESATRGTAVPDADFFASYWRYQRWVFGGDPYFSPNLSLGSREPKVRALHERTAAERMSEPLGRQLKVFRMQSDAEEATMLAATFRVTDADARAVQALHEEHRAPFAPKTVNWFLPDLDSPFYGGVNTALRMADHLARVHAVENRFVFWAAPNERFFRSAIAAAFPSLADVPLSFHDASLAALERVPESDVSIATLWATAYSVAHFPATRRKFYLIQDFEPMFYPAGTLYALAEESYRLGLYGICNTEHMRDLYARRYGGRGTSLQPAVDTSVFHAEGRDFHRTLDRPATVFVYARPGHWRNCWELASIALEELKASLGDRVRIVTAGSWATPQDLGSGVEHLGLLDYRETGNLYRRCDVGVALTVSEHPSYLPLELMACGVPVVAFDNPAGHWILRNGENCVLARRTVDGLREAIERVVLDPELGRALAREGMRAISEGHSSWEKAFSGIHAYLSNPEGA